MKNFFRKIGGGIARFFKAVWGFIKRHKKLSIFLLVLLIAAAAALIVFSRLRSNAQTGSFSMPETTLLAKMDLELTVTATGTLQSTTVKEVTSDLSYDIEAVYVEVGDAVERGQVLCALDATELDEAMADLREDIAEAEAQDAKSLGRLATSLQEAIDQRDRNAEKNRKNVQNASDAIEAARVAAGQAAGTQAVTQGVEKALALDAPTQAALTALDIAGTAYDNAQAALIVSQAEYEAALLSGNDASMQQKLAERDAAQVFLDQKIAERDSAQAAYDAARQAAEASWRGINEASVYETAYAAAYKNADVANLTTAYENAVETRDNSYRSDTKSIETAQQNYDDQAEKDSAEDLRDQLEDYLAQKEELSILSPISGIVMEMTAEVGKSAGGSTGASSGASGGSGTGSTGSSGSSSASGALFTIENKNGLEIPVSVAEYDAVGLAKGMAATVTSDALEDEEWSGTVSAVSPKAADGYFTVTVEIISPVGDLAVGMSATVDIVTESRTDVYAVPYDAVVTNSAGQTVVYALDTGGFGGMPAGAAGGTDPASLPEGGFAGGQRPEGMPESMPEGMPDFAGAGGAAREDAGGQETDSEESRVEIVVETGLETDYYIEISGEDLRDGLMILNDPLGNNVTTTPAGGGAGEFSVFGGGMPSGGAMPAGGGGGGGGGGGNGGGSPPF